MSSANSTKKFGFAAARVLEASTDTVRTAVHIAFILSYPLSGSCLPTRCSSVETFFKTMSTEQVWFCYRLRPTTEWPRRHQTNLLTCCLFSARPSACPRQVLTDAPVQGKGPPPLAYRFGCSHRLVSKLIVIIRSRMAFVLKKIKKIIIIKECKKAFYDWTERDNSSKPEWQPDQFPIVPCTSSSNLRLEDINNINANNCY